MKTPNTPKLRFPEFKDEWKPGTISQYLRKIAEPVDVDPDEQYREIGIRSHGKGLFHKEVVLGTELGDKRVFWVQPNALVINIVGDVPWSGVGAPIFGRVRSGLRLPRRAA